ncbi:heterokaryon incompatibility protein-domain-containing protein [Collybia nuda]|uniref:Heterokaryon incompatibility protein-domain-containing protein n=1 Tax=Collybia nuda TaxID=64659 RepID=A0A9P5XTA9_9AGAR|nr:heterokaryon incompatibility protein-domain-containing protein [Collybia nuda]
MRLLNANTHELIEFQSNIPPYAILSHVWQWEEITFQDIANMDKAKYLKGWEKIVGACDTAKKDGFEYIWIDTCCINKESSAELSEAINSMYAWYRGAHICYAYLWDVPSDGDHGNPRSLFAMSVWFTRGWTLQELIAPSRVAFYGQDWVNIGTKATLQEVISSVTGINGQVIIGGLALNEVPIAVRMSWAAKRNTTREEDVAYSLMGIFDVNMPLLYGEGGKAFTRLQHEIIKTSNDHSIFAWSSEPDFDDLFKEALVLLTSETRRGILARSPKEFLHSHSVERTPQVSLNGSGSQNIPTRKPTPYSITNLGLQIELPTAERGQCVSILDGPTTYNATSDWGISRPRIKTL